MAVTTSGQYADYDNVKDTFPVSAALTGTITKANDGSLIIGTGTLFGDELENGQWIYVAAISEFQQIERIISDTELRLYKPFVGSVSGATPRRIPRQTYKSISWKIDSTGTAKINNITFEAGDSATLPFDEIGRTRPDPILIDSTVNGNNVYVQFTY
jgi:hypothetical protein